MKIALIVESCLTGVGSHVCIICNNLAKNHEVHLLYSSARADTSFQKELLHFSNIGVRLQEIQMSRNINLVSDWKTIQVISKYIRENGPFDIIHCHSSKAGVTGRIASILNGMSHRTLYTPNGLATLSTEAVGFKALLIWLAELLLGYLACQKVIAVSQDEQAYMLKTFKFNPNKVKVIENGISLLRPSRPRQVIRQELGIPDDALVFGFTGRLTYQKNPELLLKAFHNLNHPQSYLLFVGTGELLDTLKQTTNPRVIFTGERTDVPNLLNVFDVFVLPSRYEGLSLSAMEAMAASLPIICTRTFGASDLVIEGVNGCIVESENLLELVDVMKKLATSLILRQSMSRASKLRFEEIFSADRMMQSLNELYTSLSTIQI
ncbi:glycosyltransferase family 4 protein [Chroococcidiopsis sp. FACHB-1243]|uniref:glycosyltransferase family 4 protein n=1 Tax=Chroococcidiopsis sp. [FACHB-1243] TaxID=2692781 RepID=UPI0017832D80|nr:glycosyltransferase family 4 protein [Chroococcidiopsis sp. [FACHB-1243]]MBD2305812.1 glycosyltransferase family 4 protein [Chroococcidiopsis sp. [FACHB-1243]]